MPRRALRFITAAGILACALLPMRTSGQILMLDPPELTPEDASQSLLQDWAKSWEAGDVGKMMEFYIDSSDLVAVESLGIVRKGPDGVRAMYRGAFDELRFEKVTLTPETHATHGDLAWTVARFRTEVRLKSDGSRYVLECRGSFAMKRDEHGWKIVMEHFSTIPDTPRTRPAP